MGLHLGIGLALSFSYILFQTIASTFAVNGNMPPGHRCVDTEYNVCLHCILSI